MNTEDLKFDKKRTRVKTCPCGKSNRDGKFVPYKDYEDKGYCHSCCQTFLPQVERIEKPFVIHPEPPTSFISKDLFKASLKAYEQNSFAQFLVTRFGVKETERAIAKYFIGSTKDGGTVFWQLDNSRNIRSGKIIHYDATTGRRVKDMPPTWIHTEVKLEGYNLKQCLFGAHLLRGNTKPVAIVESEKTAIIASVYFPDKIWLASGGKNGLQTAKMEALKGHTVTLFPDLDGFEIWTQRADELSPMLNIRVSRLLEDNATQSDREGKLDLADYLLRFTLRDFSKQPEAEYDLAGNLIDPVLGYPVSWNIQTMSPLEKMTTKYPAVAELIKRLDLTQLN